MSSVTTPESRRRQREDDGDDVSSPPNRRQRLDDTTLVQDDTGENVVRDATFYREDGDCILRVEDTLFKIHRHLLDYTDSAFHGMFSLPCGGEGTAEGQVDTNPIRLFGDDLHDIRSFFRYAYSSPLDLQYARIHSADIHDLIHTVRFTHKYRLASFERWAVTAITNICTRKGSEKLKAWPAELYVALLQLHLLSPMPMVKNLIRQVWVNRLRRKHPSVQLSFALNVVDTLQFRELLGDVYYIQLLELSQPGADAEDTQAAEILPTELTDAQKLRLLMGHRSLTLSWTRIVAKIPVLGDICRDYEHVVICQTTWDADWKRVVAEVSRESPGPDIIHRLNVLRGRLSASECHHCPAVKQFISKDLKDLGKNLQESMADHFLGPEVEPPATQ
ncbi:hypothetical protein B0H11DRAFT_1979478 [Mycena galericulata]|nr:hypothetical protein B0H11DRAFT_1979478 [Mycena galericulata]